MLALIANLMVKRERPSSSRGCASSTTRRPAHERTMLRAPTLQEPGIDCTLTTRWRSLLERRIA